MPTVPVRIHKQKKLLPEFFFSILSADSLVMESKVSNLHVVIVNWNTGKYLRNCITSLQRARERDPELIRSVVVVDNASSDDSLNLRGVKNLPLKVIRNSSNLGFAAACNQGARDSNAPYILFLNPDSEVSAETLRETIRFMQNPVNEKVGICGVRLVDDNGKTARTCSRFPSLRIYMADALGLHLLLSRFFPSQTMREWPHDETRYVDQVMGAYFCIRTSLFKELGGFDERFFVYSEEVDLSYRAHQLGYASAFLANVAAFHKGCISSGNVKAKRLFYYLRSRILFSFKHFNPVSALLFSIATLFLEPVSRLAYAGLGRRSLSGIVETMKGFGYLWAWVPQYLLFRKTR